MAKLRPARDFFVILWENSMYFLVYEPKFVRKHFRFKYFLILEKQSKKFASSLGTTYKPFKNWPASIKVWLSLF